MPPPTVICCICGAEKSKRKTLAFGDGRACREHEEVIKMLEDKKREIDDMEAMKKLQDIMRIPALTTQVRLLVANGAPIFFLLNRIERTFGKETATKVRQQVNEKGPLTGEEMAESLMMYNEVKKG